MSIYKTYKFYTGKNQRIAAFAKSTTNGQLEILLLMCSRKDHFHKKMADRVGQSILENVLVGGGADGYPDEVSGITWHPHRIIVDGGENPRKTFIDLMEANYYKRDIKWVRYEQAFLFKPGQTSIEVGRARKIYKL